MHTAQTEQSNEIVQAGQTCARIICFFPQVFRFLVFVTRKREKQVHPVREESSMSSAADVTRGIAKSHARRHTTRDTRRSQPVVVFLTRPARVAPVYQIARYCGG